MNYNICIRTIILAFTAFTFSQCSNSTNNDQPKAVTQQSPPADTQVSTTDPKKTNEQIITEGAVQVAKTVTPLIEQGLANKRYKDSLRAAAKQEFWAYTIGVPFDDIEQLAAAFEKAKDIENMAAYDDSDEYTLICTGSSKEQLEDGKGAFKAAMAAIGMGSKK